MTSSYFINFFESGEITKLEMKLAALELSNPLKYLRESEEKLLEEDLKRLFEFECEFPGKFINDTKITKSSLATKRTRNIKAL